MYNACKNVDAPPRNEAVCTLFDSFITMLQDMLRAQGAYAELLGSYLHSKRKFLTDSETAEQFVQYLQATEKRSDMERVRSSGSMWMSHEVYGNRLCETYAFDSLGAFLYVDFFRGLDRTCPAAAITAGGTFFCPPASTAVTVNARWKIPRTRPAGMWARASAMMTNAKPILFGWHTTGPTRPTTPDT